MQKVNARTSRKRNFRTGNLSTGINEDENNIKTHVKPPKMWIQNYVVANILSALKICFHLKFRPLPMKDPSSLGEKKDRDLLRETEKGERESKDDNVIIQNLTQLIFAHSIWPLRATTFIHLSSEATSKQIARSRPIPRKIEPTEWTWYSIISMPPGTFLQGDFTIALTKCPGFFLFIITHYRMRKCSKCGSPLFRSF